MTRPRRPGAGAERGHARRLALAATRRTRRRSAATASTSTSTRSTRYLWAFARAGLVVRRVEQADGYEELAGRRIGGALLRLPLVGRSAATWFTQSCYGYQGASSSPSLAAAEAVRAPRACRSFECLHSSFPPHADAHRRLRAAGALRARRRRDLHRHARRRAARARPRGRARLGPVQVVSRARGCSTRRSSGGCSTSRRPTGGRSTSSSRRSSPRTASATRTSASGWCTSSGRRTSSTAPSSGQFSESPRTARLRRKVQRARPGRARRGDAALRHLGQRRRPARALDRARGRGAAAPAAGARLPHARLRAASSSPSSRLDRAKRIDLLLEAAALEPSLGSSSRATGPTASGSRDSRASAA